MSHQKPVEIDDLLSETRTFVPPAEFRANAAVREAKLKANYEEEYG